MQGRAEQSGRKRTGAGDILYGERIYSNMMLKMELRQPYKVKKGQSLQSVACECRTTVFAIVAQNGLREELYEGQLLRIPAPANVYVVQAGDTKELLCGSAERYFEKNGTHVFYLGMRVRI